MYARLGKKFFDFENSTCKYATLDTVNNQQCATDNHKFTIQGEQPPLPSKPRLKLETQFFDKIKVPEQGQVIQPPSASEGR